jgi:hypothetical protein
LGFIIGLGVNRWCDHNWLWFYNWCADWCRTKHRRIAWLRCDWFWCWLHNSNWLWQWSDLGSRDWFGQRRGNNSGRFLANWYCNASWNRRKANQ